MTYAPVSASAIIQAGPEKCGAAYYAACVQKEVCRRRDAKLRDPELQGGEQIVLRSQVRYQQCNLVTDPVEKEREEKRRSLAVLNRYVGDISIWSKGVKVVLEGGGEEEEGGG
jgi:hypothetical protein